MPTEKIIQPFRNNHDTPHFEDIPLSFVFFEYRYAIIIEPFLLKGYWFSGRTLS